MVTSVRDTYGAKEDVGDNEREPMSLREMTENDMQNTPEKPLDRMLYLMRVPP